MTDWGSAIGGLAATAFVVGVTNEFLTEVEKKRRKKKKNKTGWFD